MLPRGRPGVSTYLEVFLLIGVAVGGAGIVLGAGLDAVAPAHGGGVSVGDPSIRQGAYAAVESVVVYNTGDAPFTFVLSTTGVSAAAPYCFSLSDPSDGAVTYASCPAGSNPGAVVVPSEVAPGEGVLLEITVTGAAFTTGTESTITATTSAGAEGSASAPVLGA